jgi:hypothetical protein
VPVAALRLSVIIAQVTAAGCVLPIASPPLRTTFGVGIVRSQSQLASEADSSLHRSASLAHRDGARASDGFLTVENVAVASVRGEVLPLAFSPRLAHAPLDFGLGYDLLLPLASATTFNAIHTPFLSVGFYPQHLPNARPRKWRYGMRLRGGPAFADVDAPSSVARAYLEGEAVWGRVFAPASRPWCVARVSGSQSASGSSAAWLWYCGVTVVELSARSALSFDPDGLVQVSAVVGISVQVPALAGVVFSQNRNRSP